MPMYAKLVTAFVQFIDENDFTPTQLYDAYMQFAFATENPSSDPEVLQIVAHMQNMQSEGFPLSRFVDILKEKREPRDELERYHAYVDRLAISAKEKIMLRSLADKKRVGEICCFVDGDRVATVILKKINGPEKTIAAAITLALKEIKKRIPEGKNYQFTFTEE